MDTENGDPDISIQGRRLLVRGLVITGLCWM